VCVCVCAGTVETGAQTTRRAPGQLCCSRRLQTAQTAVRCTLLQLLMFARLLVSGVRATTLFKKRCLLLVMATSCRMSVCVLFLTPIACCPNKRALNFPAAHVNDRGFFTPTLLLHGIEHFLHCRLLLGHLGLIRLT
jgi:hypothetical protein